DALDIGNPARHLIELHQEHGFLSPRVKILQYRPDEIGKTPYRQHIGGEPERARPETVETVRMRQIADADQRPQNAQKAAFRGSDREAELGQAHALLGPG